ncbi:MAG: winged helix-turn-helix domain-containing protein [Methanomassiliicoccales archaeon]|nr:winged helix-turn-helix domain-containing protein [Methanomassiliicoccales archaeon]
MTIGGMEFKITKLAFDDDVRRILSLTSPNAMCVKDIANLLDMPITKCYRLVRQMEKRGMLKKFDNASTNVSSYQSNLRAIAFKIESDKLCIDVEFTDGGKRVFEFSPRVVGMESAPTV